MRRLTPFMVCRMTNRSTPLTAAVPSIAAVTPSRARESAPSRMWSIPRLSNEGITLASAAAATTASRPAVTCRRYGW